MMWRDKLYVDTALPFILRSAPKIFNAVADALQWIMERNGVPEMLLCGSLGEAALPSERD